MSEKYFVYDVGSTYSKLSAFNFAGESWEFCGRSQYETTLDDITRGLAEARSDLDRKYPHASSTPSKSWVLASSSAAGGLRMVAMGYMPTVTAKAAKEVAMNAGARVLEVVSHDEPLEYRLEVLREIRPDIILLAGGTDGGDGDSLLENAAVIARAGLKAQIILAGNVVAQPQAAELLRAHGLNCTRVGNVMPTIHELRVGPAREAIHKEFIRQITLAPGLAELTALVDGGQVIPTPAAILMSAELMALGTHEQKGVGGVLIVDLGGATTDVHSVIPELNDLRSEERGLVINNDKQAVFRTVEGNLGLRVSASGIVEAVGAQGLLAWRNKLIGAQSTGSASREEIERLAFYVSALEKDAAHLADGAWEEEIDAALAAAALETALKRHSGYWLTQYNPILGLPPGSPVGRDLRSVKWVVGVGGFFASRPEAEGLGLLRDVLQNRGYFLFPQEPKFRLDYDYILYSVGLLGKIHPNQTLNFVKQYLKMEE
ncbi:MAG: glutamate mutase L [Deltaproteobacteria bacterium]|jgi:uncharacterized protein (TIGR01319 family)|nr:glutamate mutase L [Deltaproteobacteria bacterium]